MKRRSSSAQFELFPASQREGDERVPQPPDVEHASASEEATCHPTDAEEQERVEMEHGPGAQYVPPKSRRDREAARRRIRAIIDDIFGRIGMPGRQLLTDAESPFIQGALETAEERRRRRAAEMEEEQRKRGRGR